MSRCNPIDVFAFPDAGDRPYQMDWTAWLEGAIIVTSVWTQSGDDGRVEFHDESIIESATVAQVWVRGLEAGPGTVFITNTITASDGRVWAETWRFDVCGED